MPDVTHKYTAKVIITRVTHTKDQYKDPERSVTDIADFTVRSSDLEKLTSAMQQHLELIEDE